MNAPTSTIETARQPCPAGAWAACAAGLAIEVISLRLLRGADAVAEIGRDLRHAGEQFFMPAHLRGGALDAMADDHSLRLVQVGIGRLGLEPHRGFCDLQSSQPGGD